MPIHLTNANKCKIYKFYHPKMILHQPIQNIIENIIFLIKIQLLILPNDFYNVSQHNYTQLTECFQYWYISMLRASLWWSNSYDCPEDKNKVEIIFVHCCTHKLNLVLGDSVHSCANVKSFFRFLKQIYMFLLGHMPSLKLFETMQVEKMK